MENNRVIKFRAWDEARKEMWDYDNLILVRCYLAPSGIGFVRLTGNGDTEQMKLLKPLKYTGLVDRTGKEIYEGDWCRAEFRTKEGIQVIQGEIKIDEFMWCIDCCEDCGNDIFSINRPHNFEVIGNVFENPELLA